MNLVRCYWSPFLVLALSFLITYLLPQDKQIQVIAPLVVGIIMFSLRSLLGYPNVGIENLGNEIAYQLKGSSLHFYVSGVMVNRSPTGAGELIKLFLRIYTDSSYLDLPMERSIDTSSNYRFLPNGRYPSMSLHWVLSHVSVVEKDIEGKKAEIHLFVTGQSRRVYTLRISMKGS